jgi:hypothetical protein
MPARLSSFVGELSISKVRDVSIVMARLRLIGV